MTIKADSNIENFDDEEIYKQHFEDNIDIAEILGENDEEVKQEGKIIEVISCPSDAENENYLMSFDNGVIREVSEESPSDILESCNYDFN